MKRISLCLLAMLMLLSGCTNAAKKDELPNDAYDHADHHVAQTREEQNFFLETVDGGELTLLYLSYREPDGCVTQVCELDADPFHKPELVCQRGAFYYICYEETMGGQIESDGYLYRIGFDGSVSSLKAEETVALGSIVRTDDNFVYCAVSGEESYIRADLALTAWSECSKEEALASEA